MSHHTSHRNRRIAAATVIGLTLTSGLWTSATAATKTTKKPAKVTKPAVKVTTTLKPAATPAPVATVAATTTIPADKRLATMAEMTASCAPASAPKKLVFSTFPGQKRLLDSMVQSFTKATGVQIEWLENGLGDRLTKMNAEKGSPTIDVAIVPVAEVPGLLGNGVTEPTDTKLPNYSQLIPVAKMDGGYGISVLQFGIAYNPKYVKTVPKSWKDMLDLKYTGHVALPSMPNSGGYALLSMLSKIAGGDEKDLTGAISQVADYKSNVFSFIGSSTTVEEQIKSGDIWMYVDIGGVVESAKNLRNLPVEFVVPAEGSPVSINTLVLPSGNPRLGCAKAFVSFLLGEESQLAWAQQLYYGTTSSLLKVPDTLAKSLWPKPGATNIVPISWKAIADKAPDTLDFWNRKVTN